MAAFEVLKVIYSPVKAFREIISNPKFFGPILVMIIFVAASMGSEYIRSTKVFVQETQPSALDFSNPDPWTEDCALWDSNGEIISFLASE